MRIYKDPWLMIMKWKSHFKQLEFLSLVNWIASIKVILLKLYVMKFVNGVLAKIFVKEILPLKVEEDCHYIKKKPLKQSPLIFKTFPSECIFIEWINEDVIFIVNSEQLLLHSRRKILLTTRLYCLIVVYGNFRKKEKRRNSSNAVSNHQ